MKSILDDKFKYTPSYATDISKTIKRALRKLEQTQPRFKPEYKELACSSKQAASYSYP